MNLRPWKQQIPQQLIEFMDGKLAKISTNFGESETKKVEEEIEEKGGKEFKFVGLMRNFFKLFKFKNKTENEKKEQKNMEKPKKEEEKNSEDEL